jgi:hypothetical protein
LHQQRGCDNQRNDAMIGMGRGVFHLAQLQGRRITRPALRLAVTSFIASRNCSKG